MSSILRNGIPYTGLPTEDITVVAFAERAIEDIEGNSIPDTYAKKATYQKGGKYGNGNHNSLFRGKNIQDYFDDGSLYTRISSGDFDDLYVGDYFKTTIGGKLITCRIAGFDIYLHQGDQGSGLTRHHAVIVPDESMVANTQMNSTNTTEGGYKGSNMYKNVLPPIVANVEAVFGEHLITVREYLTKAVDTAKNSSGDPEWMGAASSCEWTDSKVDLMTENEVYGTKVWSSSMRDCQTGWKQLPLFKLAPNFVNPGRFYWWLRAVVSSAHFAHVNLDGHAHYHHASNSLGVRPRWLIG